MWRWSWQPNFLSCKFVHKPKIHPKKKHLNQIGSISDYYVHLSPYIYNGLDFIILRNFLVLVYIRTQAPLSLSFFFFFSTFAMEKCYWSDNDWCYPLHSYPPHRKQILWRHYACMRCMQSFFLPIIIPDIPLTISWSYPRSILCEAWFVI